MTEIRVIGNARKSGKKVYIDASDSGTSDSGNSDQFVAVNGPKIVQTESRVAVDL